MPATLGFLLALPPGDPRTAEALGFLEARQQAEVPTTCYLYCLGDGVNVLPEPRLQELRTQGARVLACAYSALQRKISLADQATFGGLGLLTDLLRSVDGFEAAGPGSPPGWTPRLLPPSPAPDSERRQVVVTLPAPEIGSDRVAEGLRVAAGLSTGHSLQITLAVPAAAIPAWTQHIEAGSEPTFMDHLRLLLESGGRIVAPTPSLDTVRSQVRAKLGIPTVLPPSAWEILLKAAFAVLPL